MYMNPVVQMVSPNPITLTVGTYYPQIPQTSSGWPYSPPFANFGVPPYAYNYTVFSGPTPTWLKFNLAGNGMMSGTPDVATLPNTPIVMRVQAVDALGVGTAAFVTISVVVPNQSLQVQKAGTNVNAPGPNTLNYDGIGAAAVVSDGNIATVTLGANMNAPPGDVTIPPNSTAVVVRKFTIAAGKKLTSGAGAIFRID
jgi:hypothetical protein